MVSLVSVDVVYEMLSVVLWRRDVTAASRGSGRRWCKQLVRWQIFWETLGKVQAGMPASANVTTREVNGR